MIDEYFDVNSPHEPWECPLCSVSNCRNENVCRICGLPRHNECTGCKREMEKSVHFCKYCGAPTVYFLRAVDDKHEQELARKYSRKTITEWKRKGVRYLNSEDIYDYEQQLAYHGEIVVPHWR